MENIDNDYPESSDSNMFESLSSLVCILWKKIKLHTNTDFEVTGCMLCVILHVRKDAKDYSDSDHRNQINNVIKTFFSGIISRRNGCYSRNILE